MSKPPYFLIALLGAGVFFSMVIDTRNPPLKWNPLGLKDGWGARWISRLLTDQADDAYHGGAKHDIKFSPKTKIGRLIEKTVDTRGESGRTGRQRADEEAQLAYSLAVKNWLRFARDIDPSNFNSFFVYYNWLVEGFTGVEVGEDGGEKEGEDFGGELFEKKEDAVLGIGKRDRDLREALAAVDMFLQNVKLQNSLDCTNAAVALWMKYEAELSLSPKGKDRASLRETLAKMRTLEALGKRLGVGKANTYDVEQSDQYARALMKNISEFISQ